MRICQLTKFFEISNGQPIGGGAAHVAYYLSKHLRGLGFEVSIMCGGAAPSQANIDGVITRRVGEPLELRSLSKLLRQDFDIVHSHYSYAAGAAFLRLLSRTPKLVAHVHHPGGPPRSSISIPRFVMRTADAVIAPSESVARRWLQFYRITEGKVRVIPNGVDVSVFKPDHHTASEVRSALDLGKSPVVLFIGHLENKGLENLLVAASAVIATIPNVTFVFVGFASAQCRNRLSGLAQSLRIEKNVRFLSFVPHSRLPAYYTMADVFVHPSVFEAFPLTPLEAMACEKPVIATKIDPFLSMIRSGIDGILIPDNTPKQLAKAILTILSSADLANKMGQNGREIVKRHFSWEMIAQRCAKIYKGL